MAGNGDGWCIQSVGDRGIAQVQQINPVRFLFVVSDSNGSGKQRAGRHDNRIEADRTVLRRLDTRFPAPQRFYIVGRGI